MRLKLGNCRLTREFAAKLSETAPTWGRLVAPYAERIASLLWSRRRTPTSESVWPTRLTQSRKRESRGASPEPAGKFAPEAERLCRECGKTIGAGHNHCSKCAVSSATERLINAARLGRIAGHSPQALAKKSETQRRHRLAVIAWNPASQPQWLTERFYVTRIQPRLSEVSSSAISSRLRVSHYYAGRIRQGDRPHPRHWKHLNDLVLARIKGTVP